MEVISKLVNNSIKQDEDIINIGLQMYHYFKLDTIKIKCLKCKTIFLVKKRDIVFIDDQNIYSDCNMCMSTNFFTLKDIFNINGNGGYIKGG